MTRIRIEPDSVKLELAPSVARVLSAILQEFIEDTYHSDKKTDLRMVEIAYWLKDEVGKKLSEY